MNVRETSKAAFYQHSVSGALLSQRQLILLFLEREGPHTRKQISDLTGIPINAVTGRVKELIDDRKVIDERVVKGEFGRNVHLVEVASE